MTVFADATIAAFSPLRDDSQAGPMSAYMKHHFAFLGIAAPMRRTAQRVAWQPLAPPSSERALLDDAHALWNLDEREYQYAACDRLERFHLLLSPSALDELAVLITTRSWWDTVDDLCRHPVGSVIRRHPSVRPVMDEWLRSDDMWLQRSAILHMETWHDDMDIEWLEAACLMHAHRKEFFIRKAIGWGLRSYARRNPDNAHRVRAFVDEHEARLSGLSKREALKRVPF
jgi:3-methyladenine DNA glycosylase AlkD